MSDRAVHARNAGKDAVARRTVWSLSIGSLRARCLSDKSEFVVQVRTRAGWTEEVGRSNDPLGLLRTLALSKAATSCADEQLALIAARRIW